MSRSKKHQPHDILNEFSRRFNDLIRHDLITKGQFRAAHPIVALIGSTFRTTGQPLDESIVRELERADPLLVESFVVRMRHLRLSKEVGSVDSVVRAIKQLASPELHSTVQTIANTFNKTPIENSMTATIDGHQVKFNERRIHEIVENGELFHSDKQDRESYLRIKNSNVEHFAHSLLMRNLGRQTEAAIDLYSVLRDQGVIRALENEPEWLRNRHYQARPVESGH